MKSPRGICVIINNEIFFHDPELLESIFLPDRKGTDVDRGINNLFLCSIPFVIIFYCLFCVLSGPNSNTTTKKTNCLCHQYCSFILSFSASQDHLDSLFRELGFEVHIHNNLTKRAMYLCLRKIGDMDHINYGCFVCCILSHGCIGCVYGTDGLPVDIADLTNTVKALQTPSLNNKPKLFFIQACQGKQRQKGIRLDDDGEPPCTIPNEADFLLGYATVPGFVSYRNEFEGSWFINTLVSCIQLLHNKHDLMTIMVKVNDEVSKAIANIKGDHRKQVPVLQATLRKKLYLHT